MRDLPLISARPRRGVHPGAPNAPRLWSRRTLLACSMLAALAVRLASSLPVIPVPHWHGAIAVSGPGGGYPHHLGDAGCGTVPVPESTSSPDAQDGGYFSYAMIAAEPAPPPPEGTAPYGRAPAIGAPPCWNRGAGSCLPTCRAPPHPAASVPMRDA